LRILLITLYYVPDIGPDPPLMSALTEEWLKLGHKVTVVCAFPHYKRDRLSEPYRGKWFEVEKPANGYKIVRTAIYVPAKGDLIRRALNYLSFALTGGLAAVVSGPHDVVVVYTPPPTNGLIGYITSRIWRAPMIYNVQDVYPDVGVKLGLFRNQRLIWLFQQIENFFYARSSAITVISDGFKRNLLAKGVPADKLNVIYNWVDTEFIRPLPRMNELRIRQGWQDKFIVLYAGNIGFSQGLELLLQAARLSLDIQDIRFVVVGEGEGRRSLEAKAMGLSNVEFHNFFPRPELPSLLACADVSLTMLTSSIVDESVPSKVYAIMASGRPILVSVPQESDTWSIVHEAGAGICAPAGNVEAFLEGLRILYQDETLRKELGSNARQWVVEHCRPDQGARKYDSLFVKLLPYKAFSIDQPSEIRPRA
jgi:colanic acid biosynthesis glycosyl transferase WcaI